MTEHSPSSRSSPVRGTRYSAARMGVDGTRRCQRGGSLQWSASARGAEATVGAPVGMAWGGGGAALGWGLACEAAGSGAAPTSEGAREQAGAAARAKRANPAKKSVRIRGQAYSTSAMRELLPAPDSIVDPATRLPRLGSYRGGLPRVDWK